MKISKIQFVTRGNILLLNSNCKTIQTCFLKLRFYFALVNTKSIGDSREVKTIYTKIPESFTVVNLLISISTCFLRRRQTFRDFIERLFTSGSPGIRHTRLDNLSDYLWSHTDSFHDYVCMSRHRHSTEATFSRKTLRLFTRGSTRDSECFWASKI